MRYSILFTIIAISVSSCGDNSPKGAAFEVEGVALAGYDPVAYFEQSEPRVGQPGTSSTYDGLTYQFSSTKNKDLFDQSPEKYVPEYGGWCAYAVAEASTKMEPDPTMWQIQDGRLLLFYDDWKSAITGSLLEEWNTDQDNYLKKADINWENLK